MPANQSDPSGISAAECTVPEPMNGTHAKPSQKSLICRRNRRNRYTLLLRIVLTPNKLSETFGRRSYGEFVQNSEAGDCEIPCEVPILKKVSPSVISPHRPVNGWSHAMLNPKKWFWLLFAVFLFWHPQQSVVPASEATGQRVIQVTVRLSELSEKPLQRTVKSRVGDTLEVRLETRAVGYVWKVVKLAPEEFEVLDSKDQPADEPKPGASEFIVHRFRVKAAGELQFEWRRPFGKSEAKQVWLRTRIEPTANSP